MEKAVLRTTMQKVMKTTIMKAMKAKAKKKKKKTKNSMPMRAMKSRAKWISESLCVAASAPGLGVYDQLSQWAGFMDDSQKNMHDTLDSHFAFHLLGSHLVDDHATLYWARDGHARPHLCPRHTFYHAHHYFISVPSIVQAASKHRALHSAFICLGHLAPHNTISLSIDPHQTSHT